MLEKMISLLDKHTISNNGKNFVKRTIFHEVDFLPSDMPEQAGYEDRLVYSIDEFVGILRINSLLSSFERLCHILNAEQPDVLEFKQSGCEWFLKISFNGKLPNELVPVKVFVSSFNNHPGVICKEGEMWFNHPFLCSVAKLMESIIKNERTSKDGTASGYKTYIMVDENSGLYKIGKSRNPTVREATLGGQIPKIKILFVCDKDIEREIHTEFSDKRVRGEWFNLSMDDVLDTANKYGFKKGRS
jgi:hypothetical protein